ncbi:MAG TPA: hypothetical protein VET85_06915 [Stellaceae bacterium]|nr:hypothetical protein [Stellaceae bacterium]
MGKRAETSLAWARTAAILALVLSLAALALPVSLGGYNDWSDWHLAVHNLAAILTRIVVFAAVGGALGGLWSHLRRRRSRGAARGQG